MCFQVSHWGLGRQALHPPSPAATSALAAASSEEEGLAPSPFLLITTVCSSEERDRPSSSRCRRVRRRRRRDIEDFSPFLKCDLELRAVWRGRSASRSAGYESYGLDSNWVFSVPGVAKATQTLPPVAGGFSMLKENPRKPYLKETAMGQAMEDGGSDGYS